ncbi:hypothetical protein BTI59_00065 [Lactobacillus delbrueckii subsp. bulgaricus]|nr:hypothetical protein [Lactobacillus delbrueckii subsp. bulgaricus]
MKGDFFQGNVAAPFQVGQQIAVVQDAHILKENNCKCLQAHFSLNMAGMGRYTGKFSDFYKI